jgi:hypothetical protein
METEFDNCFEVLLNRLCYDGNNLTVELKEQFVGKRRKIGTNSSSRNFKVVFISPTSHVLVEEFAESVANLVKSSEKGFLRKMKNQSLVKLLGLDVPEMYENLNCYALLTSHEILIVFCEHHPTVEVIQ